LRFKAHRLVCHSTLGLRVTKKREKGLGFTPHPSPLLAAPGVFFACACFRVQILEFGFRV